MLTLRFVRFAGFSTFYRLGYRKRLWLWFGLCCCFELIWIDVLISWRHGFHRNWESGGFLLICRARDTLWPRGRAENTHRHGLLTALGHRNSLGSRNLHNMNITRVSKTVLSHCNNYTINTLDKSFCYDNALFTFLVNTDLNMRFSIE